MENTTEKHAGGRPTNYSNEIREKALEYITVTVDETIEGKTKVNLPSIEGLASYIDVNRDTVYEWCKVYPEFSDIIEKLKEKQVKSLINNGLQGTYNPTIAKVLLARQGYRDAIDTDVTTKGDKIEATNDIKVLTQLINGIHRSTGVSSDGRLASTLGEEVQDKE